MTEQQARAYLALLDVETATVNDLAHSSRVPRAKLYEVLDGLSRKGLLETIPESPQRFRANPLTALFETRVEELRSEERSLKRTIGDLMLQLLPTSKEVSPEAERDFLHFAKGRTVFVSSLRHLVEAATTSITIVGDRLLLPRLRLYDDVYQEVARFQSRGTLRVLVPEDAVQAVEGRKVHVDEIADAVRTVPIRGGDVMLVVRDEEEVLEVHFVPNDLHPSRGGDRVVHNREAEFARLCARMFGLVHAGGTAVRSPLASKRG